MAEARSRASRARTAGSGGGVVQPPTRRTSGMPISRKTTSAERGLPGSPITGTPPHSASSVGLPGLMARPWHQIRAAPRRRTASAVSSRAPTDEPAEIDDEVAAAERRAERRLQRAGIVGHDAALHRLAACLGDQPGQRERGRVAHLAGEERRGVRRHHLVAGGEHRHPRPGVDGHLGDPRRGQHAEVLGAQRPPSGHQLGRRGGVLVGAHHAVAGRDRPDHLDGARHRLLRCTRSSPPRPRRAAARRRSACVTAVPGPTAVRARRPSAPRRSLEVAGQPVGNAVGVGRPHRVAVHGRAGEAGQRVRRGDRLGRDPAAARGQRDGFGRRAPPGPEPGQRLGDRPGGEELPPGAAGRVGLRGAVLAAAGATLITGPSATWPSPQIEVRRMTSSSSGIRPST